MIGCASLQKYPCCHALASFKWRGLGIPLFQLVGVLVLVLVGALVLVLVWGLVLVLVGALVMVLVVFLLSTLYSGRVPIKGPQGCWEMKGEKMVVNHVVNFDPYPAQFCAILCNSGKGSNCLSLNLVSQVFKLSSQEKTQNFLYRTIERDREKMRGNGGLQRQDDEE